MRINIVGVSAAGKSTLARRLSDILDTPSTDLDDLHWRPDWQEAPLEELRTDVAEVAHRESWIIAGNFGSFGRTVRANASSATSSPNRNGNTSA